MGHFIKNVLFAHLETIFTLIFGIFLISLPTFIPDPTHIVEAKDLRQTVNLAASISDSVTTEKVAVTTTKASGDYVIVGNNRIDIFFTNNIERDKNPGNRAGLYGKLLYAHNTSDKFAPVKNFVEGVSTFKVTLNGVTKEYKAVKKITITKEEADKFMGAYGNMKTGFPAGKYRSGSYDYVLMTCDGQDLGNGKATHRTIVFANEVK